MVALMFEGVIDNAYLDEEVLGTCNDEEYNE